MRPGAAGGRGQSVRPRESLQSIFWRNRSSACTGNRVFYTSLGQIDDFKEPAFQQLLKNGIQWATK
jgi:type 1 glutamine amidotransferase